MPTNTPFDSKDFATLTADLLQSLRSGEGGRPILTDDTEGSVVRTLSEAFARELAVCYQQLKKVYSHGFLDTAEGVALDNVVALLGISRQRAGHIEGSVSFSRPQPAPENIPIPAGTQVTGRDVILFETTETAVISKGLQNVTVKVRSLETGTKNEEVSAGKLNLIPRPIWGVDKVNNTADLILIQREESDAELRERTRHIFQRYNLGTIAAIEETVRALGITQVLVREDGQRAGTVDVILGDTDMTNERLAQADAAVQKVRPAGIHVYVSLSNQIVVHIKATLVLREDSSAEQKKAIIEQITAALQSYFASLKTGDLVQLTKISTLLTAPNEVAKLIAPNQDGTGILTPFMQKEGQLTDVRNSHLTTNGDIRCESNDRAVLDLELKPLTLSLEPPVLDVWLDVTSPELPEPTQDQLNDIQKRLDAIDTSKAHIYYEDLLTRLNSVLSLPENTAVKFNVIHSQTGLITVLEKKGDNDNLQSREKLRLGHFKLPKES